MLTPPDDQEGVESAGPGGDPPVCGGPRLSIKMIARVRLVPASRHAPRGPVAAPRPGRSIREMPRGCPANHCRQLGRAPDAERRSPSLRVRPRPTEAHRGAAQQLDDGQPVAACTLGVEQRGQAVGVQRADAVRQAAPRQVIVVGNWQRFVVGHCPWVLAIGDFRTFGFVRGHGAGTHPEGYGTVGPARRLGVSDDESTRRAG
jgi:hypothetical protein